MNNETKAQYDVLRDKILKKIESGEIRMTPRFYFLIRLALLVVVVFFMIVISSLLVSFIFFSIHVSGRLLLLGFGMKGVGVFLYTFPWGLLLVDLALLLILEKLVKFFRFGYKNPLLYLLSGMFCLTVLAGFGIYATSLHDRLYKESRKKPLPVVGSFYKDIQRPPHENGVFRGTVTSIDNNIFTMQDFDTATGTATVFTVIAPPSTDIGEILTVGDIVYVAGSMQEDKIMAFGLQKIIAEASSE